MNIFIKIFFNNKIKKLLFISLLVIGIKIGQAQQYLKIDSIKETFRYYPNVKRNKLNINDSIYVLIKRNNDCYFFTLYKKNRKLASCYYINSGRTFAYKRRKRISGEIGSRFELEEITSIILIPCNKDCLKSYF